MRKLLAPLLAAALAVVGVATAAPASADSFICLFDCAAAEADFDSHGEHLFVCDIAQDGRGAHVDYFRSDQGFEHKVAENREGAPSCKDFNFSMPESATIRYRLCQTDGNLIFNCSNTISDSANG